MTRLFKPISLSSVQLSNRIVMAPMTRLRAHDDGHPSSPMADYYASRASAALIVTECTMVGPLSHGYMCVPGMYMPSHGNGWRAVTNAVHDKGGKIFLQLWHCGRVSHRELLGDRLPLAPSAIAGVGDLHTPIGKRALDTPKEMTLAEIKAVVIQFRKSAELAKEANFDGIELHGAFGYLIDQFFQDCSNKRTDEYGGSPENRFRFLQEILAAVQPAWELEQVGIKISPSNTFYGMGDSKPDETFAYVIQALNKFSLAYLHIMQPTPDDIAAGQPIADTVQFARRYYDGTIIANGGYDAQSAERLIESGIAQMVSFGKLFLANPDLPRRFAENASFNEPNPKTFYGRGPLSIEGYTDYPALI